MPGPFITNDYVRRSLGNIGVDPDDPEVIAALLQGGEPIGAQPDPGLIGGVKALEEGFGQSLANTVRGLKDIPLAVGRSLGLTDMRVNPSEPSYNQRAHPVMSGLGGLGSVLLQFMVPEFLIGKIPAVARIAQIGKMRELGVSEKAIQSILAKAEKTREAFFTERRAQAARSAFGGLTTDEVSSWALYPKRVLNNALVAAQEARTPSILGGLHPQSILGRGVPSGLSFAAYSAAQPGDLPQRAQEALHGFGTGLVLGGLGSPSGLNRGQAAAREAIAALLAFRGEKVVDAPIPGWAQSLMFGGVAGALKRPSGAFSYIKEPEPEPYPSEPRSKYLRDVKPISKDYEESVINPREKEEVKKKAKELRKQVVTREISLKKARESLEGLVSSLYEGNIPEDIIKDTTLGELFTLAPYLRDVRGAGRKAKKSIRRRFPNWISKDVLSPSDFVFFDRRRKVIIPGEERAYMPEDVIWVPEIEPELTEPPALVVPPQLRPSEAKVQPKEGDITPLPASNKQMPKAKSFSKNKKRRSIPGEAARRKAWNERNKRLGELMTGKERTQPSQKKAPRQILESTENIDKRAGEIKKRILGLEEEVEARISTGETPNNARTKATQLDAPRPKTIEEVFREKSKEHNRIADRWNWLTEKGYIQETVRDALMDIFRDTNPKFFTKVDFTYAPLRGKKTFDATTLATIRKVGSNTLLEKASIKLSKLIKSKPEDQTISIVLHEIGHLGFLSSLTDAERAMVKETFESFARKRAVEYAKKGVIEDNWEHYLTNHHEYFAQAFSDYIMEKKLATPEFEGIFQRLLRKVKELLQKLHERDHTFLEQAGWTELFDRIVEGDVRSKLDLEHINQESRPEIIKFLHSSVNGTFPDGFGESGMSLDVFNEMTREDRLTHTQLRITDPSANDFQKVNALRRHFRPLADEEASSISKALMEGAGANRAQPDVHHAIRMAMNQAISEDIIYVPQREVVRDKKSNLEIKVSNVYDEVLAMHTLSKMRENNTAILDPPGGPLVNIKDGPYVPTRVELGDFDPSIGEIGGQVPPSEINFSTPVHIKAFHTLEQIWHQHISQTRSFFTRLTRGVQEAIEKKHPLMKHLWDTWEYVDRAMNLAKDAVTARETSWGGIGLEHLVHRNKVVWDVATGERIDNFARIIDDKMESIRISVMGRIKPSNPQYGELSKLATKAQEVAFEKAIKEAREARPDISDNEVAFYKDALRNFWDPLHNYFGLPVEEYRFGYYTRVNSYALATKFRAGGDVMKMDFTMRGFFSAMRRTRIEAAKEVSGTHEYLSTELAKLEKHGGDREAYLAEVLKNKGNYFDIAATYARHGIRRKIAGEALTKFRDLFTFDPNGGVIIHDLIEGDVAAPQWIADRIRNEIEKMAGLPSRSDLLKQNTKRNKMAQRVITLAKLANKLESSPIPKPLVNGIRAYYRTLGIKITHEHVNTILDTYMRLHRGQTFGLNLMVSTRDLISTDLLHAQRLPLKYLGPVWIKIRLNPKEFIKSYRRLRAEGKIEDWRTSISAPQLQDAFMSKVGMKQLLAALDGKSSTFPEFNLLQLSDAVQVLYRMTDVWTRILSWEVSEKATKAEFKRYRNSARDDAALDEFMLNTGVAYTDSPLADIVKDKLKSALDSGDIEDLITQVGRINESETALLFKRYNSSPVMDSTIGRIFFHYGSWPIKIISSQYDALLGPMRNLKTNKAKIKAYTTSMARYAAGAEAVYSLGALMNVDTSDWIPFFHNSIPNGGPLITFAQDIRELMSGDPHMMGKFEKNPGAVAAALMRQAFPGIPTTLKRSLGQYYDFDDVTRRGIGLPEKQTELYNRVLVSMGFIPFSKPIYGAYRMGGLPALGVSTIFGEVQDIISKETGLPGGSEKGRRKFNPLVGN